MKLKDSVFSADRIFFESEATVIDAFGRGVDSDMYHMSTARWLKLGKPLRIMIEVYGTGFIDFEDEQDKH